MTQPIRVKRSRAKGSRMPPNTVTVDRTSKFGNPFIIGTHGDRAECVRLFGRMLAGEICTTVDQATIDAQHAYPLDRIEPELRGKNLACWCPLDGPCHADLLLAVANV